MEKSAYDIFGTDIRSGNDRRKKSSLSVRSFFGGGRRHKIRRKEDKKNIFYIDQYSPKLFMVIVAIIFLSVIDAFLTLLLLGHGAYEINPIMAYLLDVDVYAFFALKYALTSVSAIGLLMLRNNVIGRINISAHSILYFFAGTFLVVVAWELYLLFNIKNLV